MSAGPGKWQALILRELERRPCFYTVDLLPPGFTRAMYSAITRAAASLEAQGRIEIHRYLFGAQNNVIKRLGYEVGDRDSIRKCCQNPKNEF